MTMFKPPTDSDLREGTYNFLKQTGLRYRELRRSGDLVEVVALKVEATKEYARVLIGQGVSESQAWHWAIREKILERDAD